MKKVLIILLAILNLQTCIAVTLQGSVEYTVEKARKEAFANVEYKLPQKIIDKNLKDPNFKSNQEAIKSGKKDLGDRWVTSFTDGSYNILYKYDKYYEYSYKYDGTLDSVGKRVGLKLPTKCYRYDVKNKLVEITLYYTTENVYTFTPDGQLKAHWIGDKCYDITGKLILESF